MKQPKKMSELSLTAPTNTAPSTLYLCRHLLTGEINYYSKEEFFKSSVLVIVEDEQPLEK
ncbi:hypothetical protein NTE28_003577 [Vibrio harveyi]|nr:hypothetical protein [Vibrio harveyi]